jgi:hypothetical protein
MPDNKQSKDGERPEIEVAYYTKELGPALQRKMAREQMAQFTESTPAEPEKAEPAPDDSGPADPADPPTSA